MSGYLVWFNGGVSNLGNTLGTTGTVGQRIVFAGGANITLSQSIANGRATITIVGGAGGGGGTGVAISAAGNSVSDQTVVFSNSNGLAFGMAGSTITGSYTVPTVTNSSWTVSDNGTSGTVGRLAFTNLNGVTLSLSTGAAGLHTIVGSHNGLTSQSNQNVTAGNGGFAFQTLSFSNANGFSFGTSAGSAITGSYTVPTVPAQFSGGNSNLGNTAGDTGVVTGRLVLVGTNGITLSGSTNAGSMTISISAGGGGANFSAGVSNLGNTAGSTGVTGTRLVFVGTNNITLSQSTDANGGTISISGAGGGAGQFSAGVSNLGNTAGATGITGTQNVFVGSGVMSLSQTTGANGATISILAPATSSLSATGFVSIATNGSTISIGAGSLGFYAVSNTTQSTSGTIDGRSISFHGAGGASVGISNGSVIISAPSAGGAAATQSGYNPYADIEKIGLTFGNGSLQFDPQVAPNFQCDRLVIPLLNTNSSNSSGSHSLTFRVGIYSRNASTLSLVASTSGTTALTHSGTAGSYSLYSGNRIFTIPFTTTMTAGQYWLAFVSSTSSAGANGSYSVLVGTNLGSNFLGHFGSSHNTTYQLTLGQGVYTAATNGIPASVAFSHIRGSDSNARRPAFIMFASGTV